VATAERAVAEVRELLAAHGVACAQLECVSPLGAGRRAGRVSLRVLTRDGRLLKVRRLESAEAAAALAALRDRVDAPFLPAGTAHGPLLVEPWIEGEPLSSAQAERRAEELGALLGRLHAATPADAPARTATTERASRARADLDELEASGALAGAAAEGLRRELVGADPGSAPVVLVHRDYCPENLVEDRASRLHAIDNEWLGLDAAGVDLGRTFSRWAAPDDAWRRFLRGYDATAPREPEALRFWLIAMAARSAMLRRRGAGSAAAGLALERLRELAA
jgi:Ser/Thr protein kinase RdoA (MazF antagonist)